MLLFCSGSYESWYEPQRHAAAVLIQIKALLHDWYATWQEQAHPMFWFPYKKTQITAHLLRWLAGWVVYGCTLKRLAFWLNSVGWISTSTMCQDKVECIDSEFSTTALDMMTSGARFAFPEGNISPCFCYDDIFAMECLKILYASIEKTLLAF